MRERQPSIADALADAGALLDNRYRLDSLIRRSTTATIHLATHRNGSSAWLKMPLSAAHGDVITLEARVASAIGSPLLVRDDGATPDGVPYLVLDPPDAESMAALRSRGRAGARLPLATVMTAGDALVRIVAALHAMGYASGGLADEDVLVFRNGDVALLDLHAVVPATPPTVGADVLRLLRLLSSLVADVSAAPPAGPVRKLLDGALAAAYPDAQALRAAWRAASPQLIEPPMRARSSSLADTSESPVLAAPPMIEPEPEPDVPQRDPDGSVIGYLRSGGPPSIPPPSRPAASSPMYDPISKPAELPRLVQATSRPADPASRTPSRLLVVGAGLASFLVVVVVGSAVLLFSGSPSSSPPPDVATAALEAAPAPASAPVVVAPTTPQVASMAPPAASSDDLELTARLRTDGAPPGRDVFLDGTSIGKTPLDTSVPCGRHTLQMVAGAPKQAIELPCGGARAVVYDAHGRWSLKSE